MRIRRPLGTRNSDAAHRVVGKLERALAEGAESSLWLELKQFLPQPTFWVFANVAGYKDPIVKPEPTWADLSTAFENELHRRVALDKLRESTAVRYRHTTREFKLFLEEKKVSKLQEISKPFVESFKVWRAARIRSRNFSRGATSLALDAAILHRIFAIGVEYEILERNPVRMEGRPGDVPERGAQPFSAGQLDKLKEVAGPDLFMFLLLRWTGMRGSDIVGLTWADIYFDRREIERITQKRRKPVIIPIHTELLFALENEFERRSPQPLEQVLPQTRERGRMTRPRLYQRCKAMGRRAGMEDAHPHRFRDTFAVDMLARGASPYDVAKLLGDEIATVEKHYAPFVRELRERVRALMESGEGLGKFAAFPSLDTKKPRAIQ
ncbi:MAG: tyrosine-type recombinase/integrase [Candidatus Acidiferrales bacterium]